MPASVAAGLDERLTDARTAPAGEAWPLLEEAHVLSLRWCAPRVRVHAATASILGRNPEGNPGRRDVSPTLPVPVADELRRLLDVRHG